MPRWGTKLILLAAVVTTIGCDQVSKRVASTHLMDNARQSYLGDSVRLEYAENAGAFLSLGAGMPRWARTALFSVGTAVLLLGCVVVYGLEMLIQLFPDGRCISFEIVKCL